MDGPDRDTRDAGTRPAGATAAALTSTPELLAIVYDELRALASAYLRNERAGHTLQTTALVHEAWLRLNGRDERTFDNRSHFFRAAALAMRRILLHHAESRRTQKRGGGRSAASLTDGFDTAESGGPGALDLLALDDALKRLAAEDVQKASVVELRYFAGCTIDETAEALCISTATVEREWRFARAWLQAEMTGDGDEQSSP